MNQHVKILEHSSSSYAPRTYYNASRAELTVAIAVDFTTAGEKCTHKAAGSKYLALNYKQPWLDNARLLYKELKKRQVKVLNIAGNGIYTFHQHRCCQDEVNLYVFKILQKVHQYYQVELIVSGGQTGVDFAAGVAAQALGIPCEMTLPKGFIMRYGDKKDVSWSLDKIYESLYSQVETLRSKITEEV